MTVGTSEDLLKRMQVEVERKKREEAAAQAAQAAQRASNDDSGTGMQDDAQNAVSEPERPQKRSSKGRGKKSRGKASQSGGVKTNTERLNENGEAKEGSHKNLKKFARFLFDEIEDQIEPSRKETGRDVRLIDTNCVMAWIAAHMGVIDPNLPYDVQVVATEYMKELRDENRLLQLSVEVASLREQVSRLTEDLDVALSLMGLIVADRLSLHGDRWDALVSDPRKIRWEDEAIDEVVEGARSARRDVKHQRRADEHREFVRDHPNAKRG